MRLMLDRTASARARSWTETAVVVQPAPRPAPAAEFAVVVPTLNEHGAVAELVARVQAALEGEAWELVVVDDDSTDGTPDLVRAIHAEDPRVRLIRRVGRRGLSSACIEGMMSSGARFFAVMDADLQHDPALLPEMLRRLRTEGADLVVATRYGPGGGTGAWSPRREAISRLAVSIARKTTGTRLSDPMSGYFALRSDVLDEAVHELSGRGFKLLLDIVLSAPPDLYVQELPYTFGVRKAGRSKLSAAVGLVFLAMIAEKILRRASPPGMTLAAAVGLGLAAVLGGVDARLIIAAGLGAVLGTAWSRGAAAIR